MYQQGRSSPILIQAKGHRGRGGTLMSSIRCIVLTPTEAIFFSHHQAIESVAKCLRVFAETQQYIYSLL